jgi:glycosyltransferase involved in cell wall biosynthesis
MSRSPILDVPQLFPPRRQEPVRIRRPLRGSTQGKYVYPRTSCRSPAPVPVDMITLASQIAAPPGASRAAPFEWEARNFQLPPAEVSLKPIQRLAFVGNSLPRRCGIATFTTDLQTAVDVLSPVSRATLVAMTDGDRNYEYPPAVEFQIRDGNADDYDRAADFLNKRGCEVVSLQHEFGIFGGDAGEHILRLLRRLKMPVVSTLHTVLATPNAAERRVLREIVDLSAGVVVMAEKARGLLEAQYEVAGRKIDFIPHGIPDSPLVSPVAAKRRRGFAGRPVLLTFGLLSPNKGVEIMIDAMPAVLAARPDAVYVVLGATHPALIRSDGEGYRDRLKERVRALGIERSVVFLDQFVDQATLIDFITMCDVYVTPYLSEAQMTSGTLAYSFGLGKAVVSTPYWHAQELLCDGRGVLVPFADSGALGAAVSGLLTDDARRNVMSAQAYTYSRSMTWSATAQRYVAAFERARGLDRSGSLPSVAAVAPLPIRKPGAAHAPPPRMQLAHFVSMCDDTGMLQHSTRSVPDRSHGYCVDDNARALLLASALNTPGEDPMPERLTVAFASFVQHAWNPEQRRFRNFMGYDRRWLEEAGSEDSHGRVIWALGRCVERDSSASRREWAAALLREAVDAAADFRSPRACAFTLLGLEACARSTTDDHRYLAVQHRLAGRLVAALEAVESSDWVWFEDELAYDNARLSESLIVTGLCTASPAYIDAGLRSLRWLTKVQTTETGDFRAIGTESFGSHRTPPMRFDQQPVEAAAAVSACLAASRVDAESGWTSLAKSAFAWYLGRNDLAVALVDPESGSCSDGLHPDRLNANRGAESVVSYLLALAEIRKLARSSGNGAAQSHVRPGRA